MSYSPVGSLGGEWFCDIDPDEVRAQYKLKVFPNKTNLVIIAKRGTADDDVQEKTKDLLYDAIKPGGGILGAFQHRVVSVGPIRDGSYDAMLEYIKAWVALGRNIQKAPPAIKGERSFFDFGPNPRFYLAAFTGGVPEVPWPFEGCPEEVDWMVVAAIDPLPPHLQEKRDAEKAKADAQKMENLIHEWRGSKPANSSATAPSTMPPQKKSEGVPFVAKAFLGVTFLALGGTVLYVKNKNRGN